MQTVALIPAYNEESRVGDVVREVKDYVDRVIVVDDGSTDSTANAARKASAEVFAHGINRGYLESLRTGFERINDATITITLDADGEIDPGYIPDLVRPVEEDEADLVLGRREHIPRLSERFLNSFAGLSVDIEDTGTGFRAISSDLAKRMDLVGVCPCGTFVLEAKKLGGRIAEVPIRSRKVEKTRGIAWRHFLQFWYLVKTMIY